jgi:hypothetical protein
MLLQDFLQVSNEICGDCLLRPLRQRRPCATPFGAIPNPIFCFANKSYVKDDCAFCVHLKKIYDIKVTPGSIATEDSVCERCGSELHAGERCGICIGYRRCEAPKTNRKPCQTWVRNTLYCAHHTREPGFHPCSFPKRNGTVCQNKVRDGTLFCAPHSIRDLDIPNVDHHHKSPRVLEAERRVDQEAGEALRRSAEIRREEEVIEKPKRMRGAAKALAREAMTRKATLSATSPVASSVTLPATVPKTKSKIKAKSKELESYGGRLYPSDCPALYAEIVVEDVDDWRAAERRRRIANWKKSRGIKD